MEVGKPTHFTVLTKGAGKAKLDVHFAGAAKGEAVRDFEIIDNHDYSYTVKYTAVQQVCLILSCLSLCYQWDLNIASPASSDPFWALAHFLSPARSCSRTMKCSVQGGVTGVYLSHPILTFSFTQQGNMAVTVTYGGDPVPKSPFVVNVAPPLDLSKVKVQGLNSSK